MPENVHKIVTFIYYIYCTCYNSALYKTVIFSADYNITIEQYTSKLNQAHYNYGIAILWFTVWQKLSVVVLVREVST